MKKLMKKKVNIFGKSFSVFAILMVGMLGLASAALVPYLSNTVTGTVDVDSPFTLEMKLADEAWSTTTIVIPEMYGSDSFELFTKLTNNADKSVTAEYVKIVVDNNLVSDVECEEFDVQVTGTTGYTSCAENATDGTAILTTSAIDLDGGASQEIAFTIVSAVNIEPGTYTFSAIIPY